MRNKNEWDKEKIIQFLIGNFRDEITEDLFDDFEYYVRYKKDQMSIDEKLNFLLDNFRDQIEEELFKDFEEYVEFRRAIKKLGYD